MLLEELNDLSNRGRTLKECFGGVIHSISTDTFGQVHEETQQVCLSTNSKNKQTKLTKYQKTKTRNNNTPVY